MKHEDYTEEVRRTAPLLGSEFSDMLHMSIGLSTESGEILDAFKKTFAYNKQLDVVNIQEELGDLFWYAFNLMRMLDLDFEEVLEINKNKLRSRYKNGFTQQEALNRNLDKERAILEGEDLLIADVEGKYSLGNKPPTYKIDIGSDINQ